MKRGISVLLFIVFFMPIQAQDEQQPDSTEVESLREVVVTGQHNPQSVQKSVFEVNVISRAEIERQGGTTLADVLNSTLNLNVTPNIKTGKSGVSLFGLDSQYFKVLIDNIPVINEEGLGNNTDLTLINIDNVERIEIVEGAMGVQYGANALSGIINIITKKDSDHKWEISAYVQEETVGEEYEWFEKGRHVQSLKIGHTFSENIYANASFTRNDFGGFWNGRQGMEHELNDDRRGHDWLPKLQQNATGFLSYKKDGFSAFYRFDYLNETIENYSKNVDLNVNPATGTNNPFSQDEIFTNNRFVHHLNVSGTVFAKTNYNVSVSFQEQTKDLEEYTYFIRSKEKENVEKGEYQNRSAFFSRGTLSNLLKTQKVSLQVGYELNNERGEGSASSLDEGSNEEMVDQKLDNYDFFASSEIKFSDRFSLMPGARISFSNTFDNQYFGSLSARQNLDNGWQLRAIVGSANRTPNFDELFTYFVNVNHDVQGNPDLIPEKGVSAFFHVKKNSSFSEGELRLRNKVSFNYLGLSDRIELIVVQQNPLAFKYINVDDYKTVGVFSENELFYKNFSAQLGASFQGVSKVLENHVNNNDDFLFKLQLNANLSYTQPDWDTTFSLFFKHIGKEQQFVEQTTAEGELKLFVGETEGYSWMDATINKAFFGDRFITTLGARNLFDVTSVNTSILDGASHGGPDFPISIGYGRSYFLKLTYNLNI